MSNEFEEIAKGMEDKQPNMAGSFQCFKCGEVVKGAIFHYNENFIEWYCSQDHKSYIEDFF